MKKYVSVFAAACMILLSGCAANNAAVYGSDDIPGSPVSAAPSDASGSSDTSGTSIASEAPSTSDVSSAAAGSGSETAAPTSGTSPVTSAGAEHTDTSAAHTEPVTSGSEPDKPSKTDTSAEHEAPPKTGDSSVSVPPADTSTGAVSSPAATAAPAELPEEYAPTYIGGDGSGGDKAVDMDEGILFDEVMADAPSAGTADKGVMAFPSVAYDDCLPYPEPCPPYPEYEPEPPQAGLLTGGEWRDNDHWSDWNELYSSRDDWGVFKEEWRISFDNRISVKVTADGQPIEGAKVTCGGASAVTDNKGRAYLFYTAINGPTEPITVEYEGVSEELDGVIGDAELTCELSGVSPRDDKKLDFMIMCDTTGSMSDELAYLQEELKDIITRIQHDNSNVPTRLSVNFYRDEGDEYVVCEYPFTEDISAAAEELGKQYAAGGGDFPEAVHTALDSAVNNHDWQEDSVKLMFLVLDAPPHSDPQIIDSVNSLVAKAAEQGIRIIPIASSGIDKSTEYLLRTMAFATGGTYTFLTNDSGIGGDHIEATVGAYNVEKLNDMMVRIVNGYLED